MEAGEGPGTGTPLTVGVIVQVCATLGTAVPHKTASMPNNATHRRVKVKVRFIVREFWLSNEFMHCFTMGNSHHSTTMARYL